MACQADPFLAALLSPNLPVSRSEWLLEAWDEEKILYRGQIDRLVNDGREWWLLDYKTSRPAAHVNWENFIASELIKYRPQLLTYREMAARFYDINPPELIRTVLYFTAGQRHVLI
jgi:ATP-dependent exoDNAse (exonuclease V) beta subunit